MTTLSQPRALPFVFPAVSRNATRTSEVSPSVEPLSVLGVEVAEVWSRENSAGDPKYHHHAAPPITRKTPMIRTGTRTSFNIAELYLPAVNIQGEGPGQT